MKENFERAMRPLLKHEGGKSNHPKDPGGRTNKGVTQLTYDGWRKRKGLNTRNVYSMTDAECKSIYREQYWDAIWGDQLPDGIDYCIFDAAVNSGPTTAVKWSQRIIGCRVDGHMGVETLAKLNSIDDANTEAKFIDAYCNMRLAFMRNLRTWKTFGVGWSRRVAEVRKISKLWIDNYATPRAMLTDMGAASEKAEVEDAMISETPTGSLGVQTASAGGIGLGATLLNYFQQATDYLSLLTGLSPKVTQIILGFVGAGAITTIIGFSGFAIYQEIIRRRHGDVRVDVGGY